MKVSRSIKTLSCSMPVTLASCLESAENLYLNWFSSWANSIPSRLFNDDLWKTEVLRLSIAERTTWSEKVGAAVLEDFLILEEFCRK